MKSSKYFNNNIILVSAICVIVSFVSQMFNVRIIANAAFAFSLVFICTCYFLSGYVSKVMIFLIFNILISAIVRGFDSVSMDYFTHILIMICTFMCIETGANAKIDIVNFKRISIMFLLLTAVMLASYYFGPLGSSYFEDTDVICLNFPNPNAAGLWLVCLFILLFYCAFLYKKALRLAFFAVAAAIIPIIIATESRNSYVACYFLVVCAIIVKVFKIKKVPNWCLMIFACLPLIAFFFYMFVIVKNIDFWSDFFAFGDKVLNNFWNCFFIGDYPYYNNSQQHNSLITIFCRFGAPATTAVCILIYQALKRLQERTSLYAVLSLGAILFTGCFEASVFVGISGLYLMLLVVPACASIEQVE